MLLKIRKNSIAILAAVLIALLLVICAVGFASGRQVAQADDVTPTATIYWGVTYDGELIISNSSNEITVANPTDSGSFTVAGAKFDMEEQMAPWIANGDSWSIKKVSFKGNVVPVSMSYWFAGCSYLQEVDFSGLDTSCLQDMANLFFGCGNLESLDMSGFNTANVTDMESVFNGCEKLSGAFGKGSDAAIKIGDGFTTASVRQMDRMFYNCYLLTEIDMSNFDIALSDMTVENLICSYDDDCKIDSFNLNRIVTPNTMNSGLEILLPAKFYDTTIKADIANTSEPSNPRYVLTTDYDGKHELLNHENHNLYSNVATCLKKATCPVCGEEQPQGGVDSSNHDADCGRIIYWTVENGTLKLSRHWSELTGTVAQFAYDEVFDAEGAPWYESHSQITAVETVYASLEYKVAPTSTANWFYGLENLASIDLFGLDTSSTSNMSGMFSGCASLTALDLSSLTTANVKDMSNMFNGCSAVDEFDLSKFDTRNIENIDGMFGGCSSLTSLDLSAFDTVRLRSMKSLFNGCTALTSVNLSSFNIANAATDENVFGGCSALSTIVAPAAMGNTQIPLTAGTNWWNGSADIKKITSVENFKTLSIHNAHNFGNAVPEVAASCTENGKHAHYECTICEQDFMTDETSLSNRPATVVELTIKATGHVEDKPATCTEQATCLVCGEKYGNLAPHTPSAAHSENIIPANCAKAGSYEEVILCSVCNDEISRVTRELAINPDAHVWDEEHRTLKKEATCSEAGAWTYSCIFDATHTHDVVIPIDPTAHKYGEWTTVVAPTCSTTGKGERACANCDHVDEQVIPMDINAHVYGEWTVTVEATCTQDGQRVRTCVHSASHTPDIETIPAIGHTFGANTVHQAATCTEPESTSGLCLNCNEYVTVVHSPALGHDMVHHDAKEPSCFEHGWDAYDACTRCDESTYHELEKISHTIVIIEAVAPTCTTEGKTYGTYCSVCGHVEVESQVIAPHGHDYGEWIVESSSFNGYTQKKRVCRHDETHVESKIEVGSFSSGWVVPIVILAIIIAGEAAFITVYLVRKYKEKITGKWQRMKK